MERLPRQRLGKCWHLLQRTVSVLNANKGITPAGASGVTANWTQSYSYDRYGNKTGVTPSGVDQNSAAIPADGLTSASPDIATNRIGVTGWDYDLTGNLVMGDWGQTCNSEQPSEKIERAKRCQAYDITIL